MVSQTKPRFDFPQDDNSKDVSVHVLSEHTFCPRSAILAKQSADDTGEDEPELGPKLDFMEDYTEHMFVTELKRLWSKFRLLFAALAPAIVLPILIWRFASPGLAILASLPMFVISGWLIENLLAIFFVIQVRAEANSAEQVAIDERSELMRECSWWALRRSGFDCEKPVAAYRGKSGLTGRPWRTLVKGNLRIPVIRSNCRDRLWRPKHIVRVASYCQLIEECELASAPFGVLLFSGTGKCVVVPITAIVRSQFEAAIDEFREWDRLIQKGKFIPAAPKDNRCAGCPWGLPRVYKEGKSETILMGNPIPPLRTKAENKKTYHSSCGDRFNWTPPHDLAVELGIVERN